MIKCEKCKKLNLCHKHHITYEPEVVARLCNKCHFIVTQINTRMVAYHRCTRKLTNEERMGLFQFFMDSPLSILKAMFLVKEKTKKKKKTWKKWNGTIQHFKTQKKITQLDADFKQALSVH